ncbi:CCA tRNA nucleotidyltransferase [Hyphococcus sp.]|uniref:CCA tRNA nucleotidyltransferase n=1 Tax=Hyphococcus sp. TaxID=2038636 RepID=UPI002082C4D5|nr:MAG: cytidine(C)-cytidine(C)-adenosine (A)]-adding enzyme [Marinicaulis sp.]
MNTGEALSPLPKEMRSGFDWLNAPHLKKVIAALEAAEPHCARFVGGCVRDSLLGQAPKDFDVATMLAPDQSSAVLKSAGLGVAPTGIEHGTVTAIVDHQGVEVTTLRADVSTDGRRATVAFTRDWAIDASRRDFTVNAIYLTPDAKLYDPVGGLADAKAKRVRFIGNAEDRIREDYLRILRFFRFSARFCETFDEAGIAACAKLKDGIGQLSAERIGAEMSGILSLPRASFALEAMEMTGVLAQVWPASADIKSAARMKDFDPAAQAPLMLAALYGEEGEGIGRALRLSNAEKSMRSSALKAVSAISRGLTDKQVRTLIYKFGKDGFADAALIAVARDNISADEFKRMKETADSSAAPVLSLSGRHIVDAGVKPGPDVSRLLALLEARWIEEDFPGAERQRVLLHSLIDAERKQ